jgi:hypothetical protein
VGDLNPETTKLKEHLKSQYKFVYQTTNKDEIDQGARQQGKGVLIFSDPKFALTFLEGPAISRASLYTALVIDKVGTYSPEVMQKFKFFHLEFFNPKTVIDLPKAIEKFLAEEPKEVSADDLEFNIGFDKDK